MFHEYMEPMLSKLGEHERGLRGFLMRHPVAYGIFPFVLSYAELANIHGHDEHLPIAEIGAAVRRTYRVLVDVASNGRARWLVDTIPSGRAILCSRLQART